MRMPRLLVSLSLALVFGSPRDAAAFLDPPSAPPKVFDTYIVPTMPVSGFPNGGNSFLVTGYTTSSAVIPAGQYVALALDVEGLWTTDPGGPSHSAFLSGGSGAGAFFVGLEADGPGTEGQEVADDFQDEAGGSWIGFFGVLLDDLPAGAPVTIEILLREGFSAPCLDGTPIRVGVATADFQGNVITTSSFFSVVDAQHLCAAEAAHYHFDNPANRGEDIAGGHDGAVNLAAGAATVSTGVGASGDSIRFYPNNSVEEMSIPHAPELDITGALTISAWVRPQGDHTEDDDPWDCVQGTITSKGGNFWFQLSQDSARVEFQNEASGKDLGYYEAPAPLPLNEWTHVALVRKANSYGISFFVNGRFRKYYVMQNPPEPNGAPVSIGNFTYLGPVGCEFNGEIDELRIFGAELARVQLADEYRRVTGAEPPAFAGVPLASRLAYAVLGGALLLAGSQAIRLRARRRRAALE